MSRYTIKQLQANFMSQAPRTGLAYMPELMKQAPHKERTTKNKTPEADLQIACVQYLELKHPEIMFWSTPMNTWTGDKKSGAVLGYLAKQKRMGVRKGIPDLCLLLPGGKFCFAELKFENGVLSEEQKYYLKKCEDLGGFSAVVRKIQDLEELIVKAKKGY